MDFEELAQSNQQQVRRSCAWLEETWTMKATCRSCNLAETWGLDLQRNTCLGFWSTPLALQIETLSSNQPHGNKHLDSWLTWGLLGLDLQSWWGSDNGISMKTRCNYQRNATKKSETKKQRVWVRHLWSANKTHLEKNGGVVSEFGRKEELVELEFTWPGFVVWSDLSTNLMWVRLFSLAKDLGMAKREETGVAFYTTKVQSYGDFLVVLRKLWTWEPESSHL